MKCSTPATLFSPVVLRVKHSNPIECRGSIPIILVCERADITHADNEGYFKFVGQVVGKAVLDGYMLDAHFTRAFYKHILGVTVAPSDLAAADPDYYKQLMWMKENDITNVLELTFSAEVEYLCTH